MRVGQAVLTEAQGGHEAPVQASVVVGQFLFTGDWAGTVKVWDMASGACTQTLPQAHPKPIMGLLHWEVHAPPSLP